MYENGIQKYTVISRVSISTFPARASWSLVPIRWRQLLHLQNGKCFGTNPKTNEIVFSRVDSCYKMRNPCYWDFKPQESDILFPFLWNFVHHINYNKLSITEVLSS